MLRAVVRPLEWLEAACAVYGVTGDCGVVSGDG